MKILIIGLGSIGARHYKNLLHLGYRDLTVYDTQKSKIKGLAYIKRLDLETLKQFDLAFVCTPNQFHIQHATLAAQAGCHLFIEKPLSYNLTGIDRLYKICVQKKLINMVACNMRFHPAFEYIKNYLVKKKLGQVYSLSHHFGYYLPYWRPGTDYTKNYAAKKSMGGGIILDDIHEFDLLFWLNNFNPVVEHELIYDKLSSLKIGTEDIALGLFKFKNKVIGSVSCDYLQQNYSRTCKVVGERGNLEWNFKENIVWLKTKSAAEKLFQARKYDANLMYLEEIKYYLKCVGHKKSTFNSIKTAKQVLNYCIKN